MRFREILFPDIYQDVNRVIPGRVMLAVGDIRLMRCDSEKT